MTTPTPADQPVGAPQPSPQIQPHGQAQPYGQVSPAPEPKGLAAMALPTVWQGPASYWVAMPLGYATLGAVLGLVLGVIFAVVAPTDGELTATGLVTVALGAPGLVAVPAMILWLPTMLVSRVLGRSFSKIGEAGGKLLGLLAILLGGGIGALAFLLAGQTPMWGFALGFFGTLITMNLGQAIGGSLFFRQPGRVKVGLVVLAVLVLLAAVSMVLSMQGA